MVEPHKTDAQHKFPKVRFMIEMLHTRTNDPTNWKMTNFCRDVRESVVLHGTCCYLKGSNKTNKTVQRSKKKTALEMAHRCTAHFQL